MNKFIYAIGVVMLWIGLCSSDLNNPQYIGLGVFGVTVLWYLSVIYDKLNKESK